MISSNILTINGSLLREAISVQRLLAPGFEQLLEVDQPFQPIPFGKTFDESRAMLVDAADEIARCPGHPRLDGA